MRSRPLVFLLCVCLLAACREQAPTTPAAAVPAAPTSEAAKPSAPPPAIEALTLATLIRTDDTLVSAQKRLGDANVVARELDGAEGETFPGWMLYPDDPARTVEVFLDESGAHPAMLRIRSETSTWTRADGIRIGLTTNELQAMNGKPFEFTGFDWDYGGAITDWHGGKLAPGERHAGAIRLCPPEETPDGYPSGDSSFQSDLDVVVAHPPIVCEYSLNP